jgi:hypothetical protein
MMNAYLSAGLFFLAAIVAAVPANAGGAELEALMGASRPSQSPGTVTPPAAAGFKLSLQVPRALRRVCRV